MVTSIPIHLPGTVFRRIYVLSPTIMSPQTAYRGGTFRSCLLATCRAYSAPTGRAASIERHHNAARRSMQRKRRVHGHTNPISNWTDCLLNTDALKFVHSTCTELNGTPVPTGVFTSAHEMTEHRLSLFPCSQSRVEKLGRLVAGQFSSQFVCCKQSQPTHRVKWRHRVYGHDTIATLWV